MRPCLQNTWRTRSTLSTRQSIQPTPEMSSCLGMYRLENLRTSVIEPRRADVSEYPPTSLGHRAATIWGPAGVLESGFRWPGRASTWCEKPQRFRRAMRVVDLGSSSGGFEAACAMDWPTRRSWCTGPVAWTRSTRRRGARLRQTARANGQRGGW